MTGCTLDSDVAPCLAPRDKIPACNVPEKRVTSYSLSLSLSYPFANALVIYAINAATPRNPVRNLAPRFSVCRERYASQTIDALRSSARVLLWQERLYVRKHSAQRYSDSRSKHIYVLHSALWSLTKEAAGFACSRWVSSRSSPTDTHFSEN